MNYKQVGSTGKRPLTAADVLYRVRVLSGYSGNYKLPVSSKIQSVNGAC